MNVLMVGLLTWAQANTVCAPKAGLDIDILGIATDVKGGKPLYCEWHTPLDASQQKKVYYAYPTSDGQEIGEVFATKSLDFSANASAPEYVQKDTRFGELQAVSLEGDAYQFVYQETDQSDKETTTIAKQKIDVIDAGFDNKVREVWQQLVDGADIEIDFGSSVFQRSLELRVKKESQDKCSGINAYLQAESPAMCFFIESGSFFVRLFLDELQLIYDSESRQLLQFQGPVNLKGGDGEKLKATIQYTYKPAL